MRLLLIEDNAPLRNTISQFLSEAGYLVDSAATDDEGLWAADGNGYCARSSIPAACQTSSIPAGDMATFLTTHRHEIAIPQE